jgi:ketosteroid isomerase-like protein
LSKALKISVGLLLSILPALGAEEHTSLQALRALMATENNFSRASVEHGIRDSFLQFFADDSIIFAPEPKNGKKFYANYEDKGRKLIWQPIFATIANSADLGVTTGPWEMKKSASDDTPIAFGQFVSIWKKQLDKSWKVIVDVGMDNPQPKKPPGEVRLSPPNEMLQSEDVDLSRRALENAEIAFAEALTEDEGGAIVTWASNDIRVFRENAFPAVGKTTAKLLLNSDTAKMMRTSSGGGMSASADLAYRYGAYSADQTNVTERGYFLSIWKAERNGAWKIIVDLQKKAPTPSPTP